MKKMTKGGRSAAGVPNPLAAIRAPVLFPLTGSGAEKKGASHTQASGCRKKTKGASNTQRQGTVAVNKGTSNAQAGAETKGAKTKEVSSLSASIEHTLEMERVKAQAIKRGTPAA